MLLLLTMFIACGDKEETQDTSLEETTTEEVAQDTSLEQESEDTAVEQTETGR